MIQRAESRFPIRHEPKDAAATPSRIDGTEQHETNIRSFLWVIDPETGYIEED
jgi:hypothetical protein